MHFAHILIDNTTKPYYLQVNLHGLHTGLTVHHQLRRFSYGYENTLARFQFREIESKGEKLRKRNSNNSNNNNNKAVTTTIITITATIPLNCNRGSGRLFYVLASLACSWFDTENFLLPFTLK